MNTKKLISAVAASAVLATGVMASNAKVASNGLGDFLIAPAFFATGGYSSNLRVINSDLDSSVLVRVVVRDSACSQEVDFPILLSPGDVWDASISLNANGNVYIKSTDDSNYIPQISNGDGLNLTKTNESAAGGYKSGYVEFYPIAQFNEGSTAIVSKDVLRKRFDNLLGGGTGAYETGAIAGVAVDDVLTGVVNVVNDTTVKASMSIPMTAISDVSDQAVSGNVIGMSAITAYDTFFPGVEDSDNTITTKTAILTALQSSSIVIPFSDGLANNMAIFTFPGDQTCAATQTRAYSVSIRDTEEKRPLVPSPLPQYTLTNELATATPEAILAKYQIIDSEIEAFRNGWISINGLFNAHTAQLGKNQAPSVISTQMRAVDVGGLWTTNWMYIPSK